jgi:hypothetical protein
VIAEALALADELAIAGENWSHEPLTANELPV